MALLSQKIRPKDKEMKIDSRIRVKYNPRKNILKDIRKYDSSMKKKKKHKMKLEVKD